MDFSNKPISLKSLSKEDVEVTPAIDEDSM
jgi:hypothetical protein